MSGSDSSAFSAVSVRSASSVSAGFSSADSVSAVSVSVIKY